MNTRTFDKEFMVIFIYVSKKISLQIAMFDEII